MFRIAWRKATGGWARWPAALDQALFDQPPFLAPTLLFFFFLVRVWALRISKYTLESSRSFTQTFKAEASPLCHP